MPGLKPLSHHGPSGPGSNDGGGVYREGGHENRQTRKKIFKDLTHEIGCRFQNPNQHPIKRD